MSANHTSLRRRLMQLVATEAAAADYQEAADLLSERFGHDSRMADEVHRLYGLAEEMLDDAEHQRDEIVELDVDPAVIDELLRTIEVAR